MSKIYELVADFSLVAMQNGHGAAQTELRLARRAGIEIKHAADGLAKRPVRVAEDDDVRLRPRDALPDAVARRVRVDDVMDEKFARAKLDDFRLLERQPHVGVAINGGDGSDFLQFGNDGGVADVARV